MTDKGAVFPMFYLPPVEYFTLLNQHKQDVLIEREEHLIKQTYRNHARIYSPDGPLILTVPVVKGSKGHRQVKDVKICFDFNWQRLHWLSLQACYRSSAFFEYYEDDFAKFYEHKTEFLFDYNEALLRLLLGLIKIKADLNFTTDYQPAYADKADYRQSINAKKETAFEQKPYFQVFQERHGFIKNLSIIDLLFNQGPQTLNYL